MDERMRSGTPGTIDIGHKIPWGHPSNSALYDILSPPFLRSWKARRMEARIKRRSGSCAFDPPGSFLEDVIRYHGIQPDIPSHSSPPALPLFHATMEPELLQSYLTWREGIMERREAVPH